jgi:[lysine-biosynthesis-protein LysW]--L-2-aminoadipate ligase
MRRTVSAAHVAGRRAGAGARAARTWVVGSPANATNLELVAGWRRRGIDAALVSARAVAAVSRPGDDALARLDVLPTLDGVEPGLLALLRLESAGVRVRNRARALVAVHDKLRTARLLSTHGLPTVSTAHVRRDEPPPLEPPLVLKPRFGSWGRDVFLCRTDAELRETLDEVRARPWYRRHGALLQELVPPCGHDLRLIVAGGEVVGAGERVAAAGEWRTNVSLGGSLRRADPPRGARSLAVAAAAAVGADLVGVDLLPVGGDRFVVIELNGAVDFDERYALPGRDVYDDAAQALGIRPLTS